MSSINQKNGMTKACNLKKKKYKTDGYLMNPEKLRVD